MYNWKDHIAPRVVVLISFTDCFSVSRRALVLVVPLVVSFGCATVANYESMLQTWVGKDVRQLVAVWGPPSNVFEVDNATKLYTWDADFGTVATPIYYSVVTTSMTCRTTFTINVDRVMGWRHAGNRCKAPPHDSPVEKRVAISEKNELGTVTQRPQKMSIPRAPVQEVDESDLSKQYASGGDKLAQRLYESYQVDERDLRRRSDESNQERFHRLVVLEASLAENGR